MQPPKSGKRITPYLVFLAILIGPQSPSWAQAAKLKYAGATTLQRGFMPEAARIFAERLGTQIEIYGGDTTPGIMGLIAGNVDIAGGGRFLREEEKKAQLFETLIGWDAIVPLVNKTNPVNNLSRRQLKGIFSGKITNWKQVGGMDKPIIVVTSRKGTAMRDGVQKTILDGEEYTSQELITTIVSEAATKVEDFPIAIAAISISQFDTQKVKVLTVDGISPCIQTIAEKKYPLVKPLTLITKNKPQGRVKEFIEFALSPEGQAILNKKFFGLNLIGK